MKSLLIIVVLLVALPPAIAQVKFNEFHFGTPDYVELWNQGGATKDLSGWTLRTWYATSAASVFAPDVTYVFPAGTQIASNDYLVVQENGTMGLAGTLPTSISTGQNFAWNAALSVVALLTDDTGAGVDYFYKNAFGHSPPPNLPPELGWNGILNGTGNSAQRIRCNDTNNARDWDGATGESTPAAPNTGQYGGRDDSRSLMITEISWGDPDGVEIVNYGTTTVDLTGYTVQWDDGTHYISAPLARSLLAGQYLIVTEPAVLAGIPPATPVEPILPSIPTTSEAFSVALVNLNGIVLDEVRVESTSGAGPVNTFGTSFQGLVARPSALTFGEVGAERFRQLDSDAGRDWTGQEDRSFGRENRCSGPRGTGTAPAEVLISEVDDTIDAIEIFNTGPSPVNLADWYFLSRVAHAPVYGTSWSVLRPFPRNATLAPGEFAVIHEELFPPAEIPSGVQTFVIPASESSSWGLSTLGYSLGLYDRRRRLVDMVVTTGVDDLLPCFNPLQPGAITDFVGPVTRTSAGSVVAHGRTSGIDTDRGSDWRGVATRTMGFANTGFVGPVGQGETIEVFATGFWQSSRLTMILNGGPDSAGNSFQFLISTQMNDGTGPILGLGADALVLFPLIAKAPPFAGVLDARGSARLDFDTGVPSGFGLEMICGEFAGGTLVGSPTRVIKLIAL